MFGWTCTNGNREVSRLSTFMVWNHNWIGSISVSVFRLWIYLYVAFQVLTVHILCCISFDKCVQACQIWYWAPLLLNKMVTSWQGWRSWKTFWRQQIVCDEWLLKISVLLWTQKNSLLFDRKVCGNKTNTPTHLVRLHFALSHYAGKMIKTDAYN